MSAAALIADAMLTLGVNALLKHQEAKAVIAKAQAEGREVSPEEMASLKMVRDSLFNEVDALLAEAAAGS